ncbi:nitrilase/cyanide hydratase and apolipo protein N-acyltransferase [Aspergillus steynii IBT 23096]|uniref:Nitrilase/cyanide hydratase and apolipo protein N-acyltransferase n=1 Tax=Aspergillus steynii IBT 23096 TaxID=1392250 RepID=A0A2I2G3W8_9EURO|nr:nitrilase/cyanide hydratase and apolipo protein N-acyltransferase [Aspergillus steynii IBT 23096]PLB47574.1 nitrilase/cyanide hydratase and apolipo protein N-acyltransferase [Aspergillus steynii IBT 23096]
MSAPESTTTTNRRSKIKLAAAQIAPCFLKKTESTKRVCQWIREAGKQEAGVVGFPETIIPGYPAWLGHVPLDDARTMQNYQRLFHNSIAIPGPETELIGEACRDAAVYAVVGCSEKRDNTTGTLWNTQMIFGPNGDLLLKHQKYVPTVFEKLVHAPGTTGAHASVQTDFGVLSTLICGENSNPLAAYNLACESATVHVASWPPYYPGPWSLDHCSRVSSQGLAYTLKAFVINACAAIQDDFVEVCVCKPGDQRQLDRERSVGKSSIVNPMGEVVAELTEGGKGLPFAEADLEETTVAKFTHDYGGHYNRPELFTHLLSA